MQETIITEESNNGNIDKAFSGSRIQKPIKRRKNIPPKSTFSISHKNSDKLSCDFCGKKFHNTGFLRRHKWTRHDQINEENNELPKKAEMLLQESNNSKNITLSRSNGSYVLFCTLFVYCSKYRFLSLLHMLGKSEEWA